MPRPAFIQSKSLLIPIIDATFSWRRSADARSFAIDGTFGFAVLRFCRVAYSTVIPLYSN